VVYSMKKEGPGIFSKAEQFHHESKTWGRLLDFFKQENTILKNRLSEVVDTTTDKEFLTLAEHFQNSFVTKDEFIEELKKDIREQAMVIENLNRVVGEHTDNRLIKKQEKLRNEMESFEKSFSKDKNEFNKYLATLL